MCGESFVKVSLLAADGCLDGIDIAVLVTMFVFVFGVWWGYFDDVPAAGIDPAPIRTTGWLLGHLALQLALVASAVGYGKVLGYELGTTLTDDTSLLLTHAAGRRARRARPDRRRAAGGRPRRALVLLRLGIAAVVGGGGLRHLADATGSAPTAARRSSRAPPSDTPRWRRRSLRRTHV